LSITPRVFALLIVILVFTRRFQGEISQLKGVESQERALPHQQQPPPPQQQKCESNQQPLVHNTLQLEFDDRVRSTKSIFHSAKSQIKRHQRQRNPHSQRDFNKQASSPRSPPPTHRQTVIDSLLSLAMASIKQPQPPPSFSTLVHGGPCGFRSPRRHQVASLL
jgi:hypothetical protein